MALVLRLAPDLSFDTIVDRAAAIIDEGNAIAYPTETFYGLGVDASNEEAIRKIFDIKGRDFKNPVSVIIGDVDHLPPLVHTVTNAAQSLINTFWPGPLTIVFEAASSVSTLLTAQTGKIGVRLSSHEFARRLTLKTGKPITATSANRSGAPECADAQAVMDQIGSNIDAVIDLGVKGGTTGSTIIDATSETPVLLRSGIIAYEEIEAKTGLKIQRRP
jgi:L-threonylcarbamoyladenylate synthase